VKCPVVPPTGGFLEAAFSHASQTWPNAGPEELSMKHCPAGGCARGAGIGHSGGAGNWIC